MHATHTHVYGCMYVWMDWWMHACGFLSRFSGFPYGNLYQNPIQQDFGLDFKFQIRPKGLLDTWPFDKIIGPLVYSYLSGLFGPKSTKCKPTPWSTGKPRGRQPPLQENLKSGRSQVQEGRVPKRSRRPRRRGLRQREVKRGGDGRARR